MKKKIKRKVSSFPTNPRRAPKDTAPQRKPSKSVSSKPVFPAVITDLKEREQTGIKTYGQSLHTKNGRDALKDLYQELLDAVVYLKQKLMEGPEDFGDYIPAIDPIETPDLRPVEHFPSPIVPPALEGIKFYESPFMPKDVACFTNAPGTFIPVSPALEPKWTVVRWWDDVLKQVGWPKKESVLEEAERLVNGDRGANYGHPLDDFSRTAGMLSSLLTAKLKEPLVAEDVAKIMVCVKLSRETNKPGRDNRVDAAGYIECLDKVIEERARRGSLR